MTTTTFARGLATIALVATAAACGSSSTENSGTSPATDAATSAPASTEPAPTEPPATEPPATEPPATEPPATEPPATEPRATDPPATEPPATEPPATDPPPTTAAPTTAPPTTAPPAPTSGTAVVYGGGGGQFPWAPLAWWDGRAWNAAGYAADGSFVTPPPTSFASVAATSLDLSSDPTGAGQVVDGLTFGASDFYCVGDETGPTILPEVVVPDTPVSLGFDAIAVTADWPLQPRPVRPVGADDPVYATIGAELVDAPTAASGEVSQAIRVDLDGDGVEEVLVTYQYLTNDQFGAENDFSIVYVRFPRADGTVTEQVLEEYVLADPTEFPTIGRYTIAAVADLNGDGVMEVATRSMFWESASIGVWGLDGDGLTFIGGGGCGV